MPTESTTVVSGRLSVEADWLENVRSGQNAVNGPCAAESGYDDLRDGAQVVIADAAGATIALGSLESEGLQIIEGSTSMSDTWCGFSFRIDVPKGEKFYSIAIGSRDPMQYSAEDLFGSEVELVLGDVPGQ